MSEPCGWVVQSSTRWSFFKSKEAALNAASWWNPPNPVAPVYLREDTGLDPAAVARVLEAARNVVWFDWSDNDDDAVHCVDKLRAALSALAPGKEETT